MRYKIVSMARGTKARAGGKPGDASREPAAPVELGVLELAPGRTPGDVHALFRSGAFKLEPVGGEPAPAMEGTKASKGT